MADRPQDAIQDVTAVRCQRCQRVVLGLVSSGRYWLRHAGRTLLIEGLTDRQRITVWCERCGKEQDIPAA